VIQNVSIGPSLGLDSINKGVRAALIGALLVVAFMAFYYRFAGMVADFALVFNILFLLSGMAAFSATLTLPGIAGIILAIGMAVDSNVLIFERIREEIRAKKSVRAAIDAGYDKAFWTVVDSHVTTLITAVILFQFGTGPIKGFAVTLSMGVAINLFTALVCTKVVFDYLNAKALSI
jgi:preprotein translocase subunit SecD